MCCSSAAVQPAPFWQTVSAKTARAASYFWRQDRLIRQTSTRRTWPMLILLAVLTDMTGGTSAPQASATVRSEPYGAKPWRQFGRQRSRRHSGPRGRFRKMVSSGHSRVVQGFFLNQCTDDTVNGQPVNGDGFRGRARGIGPQLRWDWSPGSALVFKYQHEMSVRNRPQGERFWMEVSVPCQ